MSTALRPAGADPTLEEQVVAWRTRPLLRAIYHDWYRRMQALLSTAPGRTVELGCGIGTFKEFMPSVVATDVIDSPFADEVVDASSRLPYADGSLANLVMVDVIHHLEHPVALLEEAARVLAPGGRLVALEPYCSPVSTILYRRVHFEDLDDSVDPFSGAAQTGGDPWEANIALPTLLFYRQHERLSERIPELRLVSRERLAWLVYPLSGGWGLASRRLVPHAAVPLLRRIESLLPLERLAAFRCLVALEKR